MEVTKTVKATYNQIMCIYSFIGYIFCGDIILYLVKLTEAFLLNSRFFLESAF